MIYLNGWTGGYYDPSDIPDRNTNDRPKKDRKEK